MRYVCEGNQEMDATPTICQATLVAERSGRVITEMRSDGYFNATKLCRSGGKELKHYIQNQGTKAFHNALQNSVGFGGSPWGLPGGDKFQGISPHNHQVQMCLISSAMVQMSPDAHGSITKPLTILHVGYLQSSGLPSVTWFRAT